MFDGHSRLFDRADAAISESKSLVQEVRRNLHAARRRAALLKTAGARDRAEIDVARRHLRWGLHAQARPLAFRCSRMMDPLDVPSAEKFVQYRAEAQMATDLATQTDNGEMRSQLEHIARVYWSMVAKLKLPSDEHATVLHDGHDVASTS